MQYGAVILTALILSPPFAAPAQAEDPDIAAQRAQERKVFTDAEITDGFLKVALGAELRFAGEVNRIRKYDGPVRVFIDSRATPDRRAQVTAVVNDVRTRIQHLDIAVVQERTSANVMVNLVRNRDFARTIRAAYGRERSKRILKSLDPQCLSGFRKDKTFRITNSDIFLVADAGDFIFYDCVYEELLQSLGPINDDSSVPWTMFNDDVQMGFFDVYDQYLLNILYDPRIRPGMTRDEVKAMLPQILPDVRAWVAKTNDLKP